MAGIIERTARTTTSRSSLFFPTFPSSEYAGYPVQEEEEEEEDYAGYLQRETFNN